MIRFMRRFLVLLAVLSGAAFGQGVATIDEIVVTAAPARDRVTPPPLTLDQDALQEFQPIATADVFRNITGVSMRTNSRGESVIRIRGAEERQTLVFLDGAPLATPWDGRADLALLPAGLIDRLDISRGVIPIEYGPNAIGGVVDLFTFKPVRGGDVRADLQLGSLGTRNANIVAGTELSNGWSFVGGASTIHRDAERIAERSSVPFDPTTSNARTNTDLSGTSFFAASGHHTDAFSLWVSALHADVERGIAAQGDLDPDVSSPRVWRTPEWRLTQLTVNGRWDLHEKLNVRITGWQQNFQQTIDAFEDYSYATLNARERGRDRTSGSRVTFNLDLDRATLRFVSTIQVSTHDNQEFEADTLDEGTLVAAPLLRYRQQLSTLGAEADVRISEALTTTFGIAVDRADTPLTGDKPALESLSASGWSTGLRWAPSNQWSATATLGQRTRFPTPRELYGAALGRFLVNPDLLPERALLGDLAVSAYPNDSLSFNVAVWANRSDDTLSQRAAQDGGASKRQRYNTNSSLTYGIDSSATWFVADNFRVELSAALQGGRMEREDNGERPMLLQRPEAQVRVALDWQASQRVDLRAEVLHTSAAHDLADDGSIARLPAANCLNLRGFFHIDTWAGRNVHLTASIDNLTDELVLPQLGLPAPGRSYRLGLRVN